MTTLSSATIPTLMASAQYGAVAATAPATTTTAASPLRVALLGACWTTCKSPLAKSTPPSTAASPDDHHHLYLLLCRGHPLKARTTTTLMPLGRRAFRKGEGCLSQQQQQQHQPRPLWTSSGYASLTYVKRYNAFWRPLRSRSPRSCWPLPHISEAQGAKRRGGGEKDLLRRRDGFSFVRKVAVVVAAVSRVMICMQKRLFVLDTATTGICWKVAKRGEGKEGAIASQQLAGCWGSQIHGGGKKKRRSVEWRERRLCRYRRRHPPLRPLRRPLGRMRMAIASTMTRCLVNLPPIRRHPSIVDPSSPPPPGQLCLVTVVSGIERERGALPGTAPTIPTASFPRLPPRRCSPHLAHSINNTSTPFRMLQ